MSKPTRVRTDPTSMSLTSFSRRRFFGRCGRDQSPPSAGTGKLFNLGSNRSERNLYVDPAEFLRGRRHSIDHAGRLILTDCSSTSRTHLEQPPCPVVTHSSHDHP